MKYVSMSSREVLIAAVHAIVMQANEEQLKYIRSTFDPISTTPPRKRKRQFSPVPCEILCVGDEVISAAIFPLMGLSDHFRLARTCRRFFSLSGCYHPPPKPSTLHVRPCAWNKHVKVPVGINDYFLAKMCHSAHAPSFSLADCTLVSDDGLAHLQQLPIHTLNLSRCNKITDQGFAHLQQLDIHTLDLSYCNKISDDGLNYLRQMPLTKLNLSGCISITNQGLAHLQQLPIRILELRDCGQISDVVHLQQLAIHTLDLSGCNITDQGLANLRQMPITTLHLSECKNITIKGWLIFSSSTSTYWI